MPAVSETAAVSALVQETLELCRDALQPLLALSADATPVPPPPPPTATTPPDAVTPTRDNPSVDSLLKALRRPSAVAAHAKRLGLHASLLQRVLQQLTAARNQWAHQTRAGLSLKTLERCLSGALVLVLASRDMSAQLRLCDVWDRFERTKERRAAGLAAAVAARPAASTEAEEPNEKQKKGKRPAPATRKKQGTPAVRKTKGHVAERAERWIQHGSSISFLAIPP